MTRNVKRKIPAMIAMALSIVSVFLVLIALIVSFFESPADMNPPPRFRFLPVLGVLPYCCYRQYRSLFDRCYPHDRRAVRYYNPTAWPRCHCYDGSEHSHVYIYRRSSRNKHPYLEPVLRRHVRSAGVLHPQFSPKKAYSINIINSKRSPVVLVTFLFI